MFVQENHTTDSYFGCMRPWGVNVAGDWPALPNPPVHDPAHDRAAYVRWLDARRRGLPTTATRAQLDADVVVPYYAYLAATGAFVENHCAGWGTGSAANHLLLLGGQSPVVDNPTTAVSWDLPTVLDHAGEHGASWRAYTGSSAYPLWYVRQLKDSPHVVTADRIAADAARGRLARLSFVWHDEPDNEHPSADVSAGQDLVWRAVDGVVAAGRWDSTVFFLTWDDWGGFDDHVVTPDVEHTRDGVQLGYGPRVPLLMFGGRVPAVVDSRWSRHPGIGRTALELLGLPPLGVPRMDTAPSLADLVADVPTVPPPPRYGTTVVPPSAPVPPRAPRLPPPPPPGASRPVGPIVLRDGAVLPPPGS